VRDGPGTLKKGGKLVVVGVFPTEVPVNMGFVQDRELKLIASLMRVLSQKSIIFGKESERIRSVEV
jgi:threonine dehydrogenase-like Zn-dependent dehydrogenase